MVINLDIADEISPMIERALQHNKAYLRHITKSLGWYIQKEVKAGIKSGAPGGDKFPERIPWKVRHALQGRAARSWYGSMVRAVGYEYRDGVVNVGWTSRTAAKYGRKQEEGYSVKVTPDIRLKWFKKAHIILNKETKELTDEPRPVFDPMARVLEPRFPKYVEDKVTSYMTENVTYGKKNRRKYRVYGG